MAGYNAMVEQWKHLHRRSGKTISSNDDIVMLWFLVVACSGTDASACLCYKAPCVSIDRAGTVPLKNTHARSHLLALDTHGQDNHNATVNPHTHTHINCKVSNAWVLKGPLSLASII